MGKRGIGGWKGGIGECIPVRHAKSLVTNLNFARVLFERQGKREKKKK